MKETQNSRPDWPSLKTIALAATVAGLFWSIQTRAYPRHNGDYLFWHEMPEVLHV